MSVSIPALTVAASFAGAAATLCSSSLTEYIKARFGRRPQAEDLSNKSHDQLQEDLAGERALTGALRMEVATARANEDVWRSRFYVLEKENIDLVKQKADLEISLNAVLRGGLTK